MINRIVGQNSGIDVDTVVKQSLSKEQNRIDKAYQKQKVYEYQQEQLRTIVSDGAEFYDKYLDILGSSSMFSSKTYETVKFTSSDESVTAKGYAGADVTDYKVTVNQIAKKAKATIGMDYFNDVANKGKGSLSIEMKDPKGGESKKVSINLTVEDGEINLKSTVTNINAKLKKEGIAVTAKYSELANGIVFESDGYGENVTFGIGINDDPTSSDFAYKYYNGENAKGIITKGEYVYIIDKPSNIVTVDNVEFKLNAVSSKSEEEQTVKDLLPDPSKNKVTSESCDGKIISVTQGNRNVITKEYLDGVIVKKVDDSNQTPPTSTKVIGNLTHLSEKDAKNNPDFTVVEDLNNNTTTITQKISSYDGSKHFKITVINNDDKSTSTKLYKVNSFSSEEVKEENLELKTDTIVEKVDGKEKTTTDTEIGQSASTIVLPEKVNVRIESPDGKIKTTILHGLDENGKNIITTRTVMLGDNNISSQKVEVKYENGDIKTEATTTTNEPISLSGKTDIKELKDTIIKFVDDYNKFMKSINDKLWEKRDTEYQPLTEAQKKEMTESQIKDWEKKAQEGLLRSDSDLKRIQQSMKSAMGSLMSGTGLTLEKIGIKPLKDYTTKNGMFEVDENTLTKALESNSEEVKDLFTRAVGEKDENGEILDKGGVLTQLKSVLKGEIKSSTSILSDRIGFDGTATASSNTLSKNISEQKKLIKELQSKYTTKENALYKKYSNLEVMLEKLNAQTNSLASLLGTNN